MSTINHTFWNLPEFGWELKVNGDIIRDSSITVIGKFKNRNKYGDDTDFDQTEAFYYYLLLAKAQLPRKFH